MPRIDRATGVPIMTVLEFFAKEGKAKGQTATEAMTETLDEMKAEVAQHLEKLKTPAGAFDALADAIIHENEMRYQLRADAAKHHEPITSELEEFPDLDEVLEVTGVWYSQSIRSYETILAAKIRFVGDPTIKVLRFTDTYWGGTVMTPPEQETELVIDDA